MTERLHAETLRVVQGTCRRKRRYDGPGEAQSAAKAARARGAVDVHAYHCPFGFEPDHWHIGATPTMVALAALARAIRDLHGNRPTVTRSAPPAALPSARTA